MPHGRRFELAGSTSPTRPRRPTTSRPVTAARAAARRASSRLRCWGRASSRLACGVAADGYAPRGTCRTPRHEAGGLAAVFAMGGLLRRRSRACTASGKRRGAISAASSSGGRARALAQQLTCTGGATTGSIRCGSDEVAAGAGTVNADACAIRRSGSSSTQRPVSARRKQSARSPAAAWLSGDV